MNPQEAWDALLTWCSETGSGTLVAFKRSCRHLGLAAWQAARVLCQLGHVEFDFDRSRYAAAPSTLTTIPGLPGRLLLTGARPYGLVAALAQQAQASTLDVDVWQEACHQFGRAPSTALIDADPADAQAFSAEAGVAFTAGAGEQISRRLPAIDIVTATVAHRPDLRFPHAAIDPYTFQARWDTAAHDVRQGLWQHTTFGGRRQMILHLNDEHSEPRMVIDPSVAPYLMARPEDAAPIVEYRRSHRLLIVNAAAPLPALHARAACLCSGRMAVRRDAAPGVAHDHYVNVDPQVAERILRSLGVTA